MKFRSSITFIFVANRVIWCWFPINCATQKSNSPLATLKGLECTQDIFPQTRPESIHTQVSEFTWTNSPFRYSILFINLGRGLTDMVVPDVTGYRSVASTSGTSMVTRCYSNLLVSYYKFPKVNAGLFFKVSLSWLHLSVSAFYLWLRKILVNEKTLHVFLLTLNDRIWDGESDVDGAISKTDTLSLI